MPSGKQPPHNQANKTTEKYQNQLLRNEAGQARTAGPKVEEKSIRNRSDKDLQHARELTEQKQKSREGGERMRRRETL